MAQLRHDYSEFQALDTEILVMVPNGPKMISRYFNTNSSPYPILSDKGSKVASDYLQVRQFFKLGTPSVFVVDKSGTIIYAHYAASFIEEPSNSKPLTLLKQIYHQ